MNKDCWYLDNLVSGLEKLGITCKDSEGNWKTTESILQEIAEKWDTVYDMFKNKEELSKFFNLK